MISEDSAGGAAGFLTASDLPSRTAPASADACRSSAPAEHNLKETTNRESLFAARERDHWKVVGDLAPRYLNAAPEARYEIVRAVLRGERCPHGYPDQGDGCEVCSVPSTTLRSVW